MRFAVAGLVTGLLIFAPGSVLAEPDATPPLSKAARVLELGHPASGSASAALVMEPAKPARKESGRATGTGGAASTYWTREWRRRWRAEHRANVQRARTIRRLRRELTVRLAPQEAICAVFGRYCGQALTVAECESHLYPYARNGQYLGVFQMGESERARFGHGPTVIEQARAAYRYFAASGFDWSPWECKP